MPRFEIKGSPISVAYGVDHITGMFLSVSDSRLKYDKNASEEVNSVTEKVGVKDGGGSYFDLHTGEFGFGFKVSQEVMLVYLKRYGVTEDQIKVLLGYKKESSPQKCIVCKSSTTKSCQKCKTVFYCDKPCQIKDWPSHKAFCGLLPFPPAPKDGRKRVRAIFFPENNTSPEIMYVPIETCRFEGHALETLSLGSLITMPGYMPMRVNPLKGGVRLKNSLHIAFRDNYFYDGSKPNQSVAKFTGGTRGYEWRGPVLVCKLKGEYGENVYDNGYLDIDLEDLSTARDFFLCYGVHPC